MELRVSVLTSFARKKWSDGSINGENLRVGTLPCICLLFDSDSKKGYTSVFAPKRGTPKKRLNSLH